MKDTCAICLDLLLNGNQLSVLNCGHCLHSGCLERLQASLVQPNCPCCRRNIEYSTKLFLDFNSTSAPTDLALQNLSLQTQFLSLREQVEDYQAQLHQLSASLQKQTSKADHASLLLHNHQEAALQNEQRLKNEISHLVRGHEAYKLACQQRMSELEVWKTRKIAAEVEELASSSWEMISTDDYLQEKALSSSKEELLTYLATWIAKTRQMEEENRRMEQENRRMHSENRRMEQENRRKLNENKRKLNENKKQKRIVVDLAVETVPAKRRIFQQEQRENIICLVEGQSEMISPLEGAKKLKTFQARGNTFYRASGGEKMKSLLNRKSDGRGNFQKVFSGA